MRSFYNYTLTAVLNKSRPPFSLPLIRSDALTLARLTAHGQRREETSIKQPTFHGRVLLPLSVFADARAGDPLAMERILRYYDSYMNKLCTRTLYELDGSPYVRVDEYMKHRLQNKLIWAILKDSL